MPSATVNQLFIDKLESSGLTPADAKILGFTAHDSLKDLDPTFDAIPGMRLPYLHPLTGEEYEVQPKWGTFYRVRRFDLPDDGGFGSQVDKTKGTDGKKKKKDLRYTQPPRSGLGAYYPKLTAFVDEEGEELSWHDILVDTNHSVVITEGELKAAKACKHGIPTIGLGGVWSYRQGKAGQLMVPDLELMEWPKRKVYLVFDSDIATKDGVALALNSLAEELHMRGAICHFLCLPDTAGEGKVGLDDFIIASGHDAVRILLSQCADDMNTTKKLWRWNEEWVHCLKPNSVIERRTGDTTKKQDWVEARQKKDGISKTVDTDGSITIERVAIANQVFSWPAQATVEALVYDPSLSPLDISENDIGKTVFNVWSGWEVTPVQGNLDPWLELLDRLFAGKVNDAAKKWLLQWFAYPIQYPGTKLKTAVLMIGDQGAGKSMLAEALEMIYGNNFKRADVNNFFSQFNEWAYRSQFVLADEVIIKNDQDRKKHASALKDIVTRKKVTVNEKFGLKYDIEDRCNIYMTANPIDSLPIENKDRRYFVFKSEATILDAEFLRRWDHWKETGGARHLLHYLLNEVDTSDFDPNAAAYVTASKKDIVDMQMSDLQNLARAIMENGIPAVGQIKHESDLWTVEQIFNHLSDDQKKFCRNSPTFLKNALVEAGMRKYRAPETTDGRLKIADKVTQLFVLRNFEKWEKAKGEEARKHHLAHTTTEMTGSKF